MIIFSEIKPDMSKASKLPMTDTLFTMAESDIQSGLNLLPSEIALRIDQRLVPEQKLWSQELLQTAALIDTLYGSWGYGFNFDIMILELKNVLGWRVVSPVACQSGQIIDPVTRKCVTPRTDVKEYACQSGQIIDPVTRKCVTPGIDAKKASLLSSNTIYILIGGIALMLIMGRK